MFFPKICTFSLWSPVFDTLLGFQQMSHREANEEKFTIVMAIVSDYFIHVGYDFFNIFMHVWALIKLLENTLLLNLAVPLKRRGKNRSLLSWEKQCSVSENIDALFQCFPVPYFTLFFFHQWALCYKKKKVLYSFIDLFLYWFCKY